MESTETQLSKCALFQGLSENIIHKEILPYGYTKEFLKGAYLLNPQQRLDYFGVVLKGKLHTIHLFSDGNCSIIDVLEEGEIFGADLICTKSRISPYYLCAAVDTKILLLPWSLPFTPGQLSEDFRQALQLRLLHLIGNSNMQKEYRLAILSQKGLRERIITYLKMQSQKRKVTQFTIPFSREDLASFLCVNRSALSHELSKMQEEGLIRFHKNEFTLLRPF